MVLLKISLLALLLALVECTQIKLSPPNDLHVDDRFGRCIKASSDLLIISKLPSRLAAYSNTIESDSAETFSQTGDLYIGTLYVYGISLDPSSATPLVIKTPDSNIFNNFGDVLDLTDDYLFVGASNDDTGGDRAGSVYVFRKNQDLTFSFLQKLLGAKAYQNFGMTLVAQDSTLVIGAPGDDEKGTDAGAVYIFNWDAETEVWRQKEKILPKTSVTEGGRFGYALAIDNLSILVSSKRDSTSMRGSVTMMIFNQASNKWMFDGIFSDLGETYTSFGKSVSITGDTLAVGAAKLTSSYGLVGSVLLYSSNNFTTEWAQKDVFTSKDPFDEFGSTFAFHPTEKILAVSATYANTVVKTESDELHIESAGAVYIFAVIGGEWKLQTKITALDAESGAYFGNAVTFNENTLYIAAQGMSSKSSVKSGAVYLVDVDTLQGGTDADGQNSLNSTSIMSVLILILIFPAVVFFGIITWKRSEMGRVSEITVQSTTMAPMHHKYGEQYTLNSPMSVASTPRSLRESIYDAFFKASSTPVAGHGLRKNEPGSPQDYEMVSKNKEEEVSGAP